MMNSNTYTTKNYKSNERALADLLGQLVRGRNSSPTGFSRRGGSGMNDGGVGGSMNNFDGPPMGMRSGGGGGGGGWGGNAPNDWNQGSGGGGGFGGGGGGFGGSGGGYGGGGGGGGGGNIMPLMQRDIGMNMNDRGGGGFGGMSRGDGMNDGFGGGMSQMPQGGGGMNDNFGGNFMGMSRGNQGNFGGMSSNMGMNNSNFGGGGFSQSNDDDFAAPPAPRSRGMWVSGSSNRSSRNEVPALINSSSSRSRPSNHSPPRRRRRRSLSGSRAPLSSRRIRGSAGASASRPAPAAKRRAPPASVTPTKAKISNTSSSTTQRAKAAVPSVAPKRATAVAPRRVLTSLGGRWYQHFLKQGLNPEAARKKAFEHNETVFPELPLKKKTKSPLDESSVSVRVGIFAKGFPENMLDPEDLSTLEELIIDEVANSGSNSTGSKIQFERLIKKPGMLIIDCANQHSAEWLKELIPKLPNWENPELEICEEDDIPDATVMTISLPRSAGQEYDQTLAFIQAQNDDLVTDSWEWVSERTDGERLVITIRVDKESFNTMKENRFKIFYKFGLVEVNFARYLRYAASKQRRREEAAAEGKVEAKEDVPQNDAEDGDKEMKDAEEETGAEAEAEAEAGAEAEVAEGNPPSPPPAPVISIDD